MDTAYPNVRRMRAIQTKRKLRVRSATVKPTRNCFQFSLGTTRSFDEASRAKITNITPVKATNAAMTK